MVKFMGVNLSSHDLIKVLYLAEIRKLEGWESPSKIHYGDIPPRTFYDLYQQTGKELPFVR
jgi:hypothetical protein